MLTNGIRFQYKSPQPLEKSQQNCQRMRFRLGSSHLTFIRIEIGSKEASVWNRKFCLKYNTLHRFDLKLSQCAPNHLFLIMVWYFIYDQQTVLFLLLVLFLTFTLICWDFLNNNSLADSECFAVGIYRVTRWLWRIYYSFIPVYWFVGLFCSRDFTDYFSLVVHNLQLDRWNVGSNRIRNIKTRNPNSWYFTWFKSEQGERCVILDDANLLLQWIIIRSMSK